MPATPSPDPDHDRGLAADLQTLMRQRRRGALRWLGGAGALALTGAGGLALLGGCGGGGSDDASTAGSSSSTTTTSSGNGTTCATIPEETAGPYPGDGSNNANGSLANALALSGIVRQDIRSSIAGASGTATGVPLTVALRLVDSDASCADLAGYAVYLWHCDALGRYSMYSSGVTGENYLRGVQVSDSAGGLSFTTVFPGCYPGRMPHIHFEIYRDANTATSWSNKLHTSQLALPVAACEAVYATSGYPGSAANLAALSFAGDNVFSDGVTLQLAELTGNPTDGYVATLQVGF